MAIILQLTFLARRNVDTQDLVRYVGPFETDDQAMDYVNSGMADVDFKRVLIDWVLLGLDKPSGS